MAPQTDIVIGPGEHVLILGQGQTGKSIIATAIARGIDTGSLVIMDPKRDPDAVVPNCAVVRDVGAVLRHLPGRVCWQPRRMDLGHLAAAWDRICRRLLELAEAGHSSTVVIHELADLGDAHSIGPYFRQVITEGASVAGGRSRGGGHVTAIMVSQRPRNIPVIARSEARHVICLTLTNPEDRKIAAELLQDIDHPEWASLYVEAIALPKDHTWWYRGTGHRLTLHDPVALPHQR